jgi:hypothetical protein
MDMSRLIAWFGSALSNVTLFGAVAAGWPSPPEWLPVHTSDWGPVVVQLGFTPYITAGSGYGWSARNGPQCPIPHATGWSYLLQDAPLPWQFDPASSADERLYACVRLDAQGEVLGVGLIEVDGRPAATALIETIRREWRFLPLYEQEGGWVSVRLNYGLAEPPLITDRSTE